MKEMKNKIAKIMHQTFTFTISNGIEFIVASYVDYAATPFTFTRKPF